jgi:hypothetical protein
MQFLRSENNSASRLGRFFHWKTKEIVLQARYFNAPDDSIAIQCSGILGSAHQ